MKKEAKSGMVKNEAISLDEEKLKKAEVEKKERQNKGSMYWIIGVIIVLALILIFYQNINQGIQKITFKLNTFKYENITFVKTKYSGFDVFYTYYFFSGKNGKRVQYNMYLNEDPRKNNITVEGNIGLTSRTNNAYISIDTTGFETCNLSLISVQTLAQFTSGNGFITKGTYSNKTQANERNGSYVTCETNPLDTVIEVFRGNESKITSKGNCYKISIGKCEDFLKAAEKFEVQAIVDAKNNIV